jgi:hypothetical protein
MKRWNVRVVMFVGSAGFTDAHLEALADRFDLGTYNSATGMAELTLWRMNYDNDMVLTRGTASAAAEAVARALGCMEAHGIDTDRVELHGVHVELDTGEGT